jgi:hypothetical protein
MNFVGIQAAKDLGGFSVMFFIIYFAFAQLGYLLFGVQVLSAQSLSHPWAQRERERTRKKTINDTERNRKRKKKY